MEIEEFQWIISYIECNHMKKIEKIKHHSLLVPYFEEENLEEMGKIRGKHV